MDVLATTRDRLLMIGAVTAIVGTRITTGTFPQSTELPAIAVQLVSEVQRAHLRGGESLMVTRVQVSSLATTRAAVVALDQAVEGDGAGSGLANWSGAVGSPSVLVRWVQPAGVRELFEPPEKNRYRIDRDYLVHHRR